MDGSAISLINNERFKDMFTTWYKIKDENEVIEINNTLYCGLQSDYAPTPVYFIRDVDGVQTEIPISSLAWLKFSKERFQSNE